jgi:hypothetical protein
MDLTFAEKAVAIFFGMSLLDFIWAKCVSSVANGSAIAAANWGFITSFLTGIITIIYVAEPMLLLPAAAGAWVGVYLAKRIKK